MPDRIYSIDRITASVILLLIVFFCVFGGRPAVDDETGNVVQKNRERDGTVVRSSRKLMGTTVNLAVWTPPGTQSEAARAIQSALDEMSSLEEIISSWKPGSETSIVNRSEGRVVPVSANLRRLLDVSLLWARQTNGAFDITAGPLVERWRQARESGLLPTQTEISGLLHFTGHAGVILHEGAVRLEKPGMRIDFGAIGKGFVVDCAAGVLKNRGFRNFVIDAGGDVLVNGSRGETPWQIAIRHPRCSGFMEVLGVWNRAIATSGDYEQFSVIDGVRYCHILDPRTGWPTRHFTSVTVFTEHGVDADALATALFVMEPESGMEFVESLESTEALVVLVDGTTRMSKGLRLNQGSLELIP